MRIISNFRDYYDTALGYGIDETVIYHRKTKTYRRNDNFKFPEELNGFKSKVVDYVKFVNKKYKIYSGYERFEFKMLLFCGKIYIYCYDDIYGKVEFMDLSKYKKAVGVSTKKKKYVKYISTKLEATERVLHEFNVNSIYRMNDFSIFHDNDSPIIMENHTMYGKYDIVVINPCLRDVGFYKLVDAFTAFQEISMFVGGVLAIDKTPPVKISDEDMLIKKGFDDKSFRKPPSSERS